MQTFFDNYNAGEKSPIILVKTIKEFRVLSLIPVIVTHDFSEILTQPNVSADLRSQKIRSEALRRSIQSSIV